MTAARLMLGVRTESGGNDVATERTAQPPLDVTLVISENASARTAGDGAQDEPPALDDV